jgi:hypothetical protein
MEPTPDLTVGDLLHLLSSFDPTAPVRLAINPFFPMAHRIADVLSALDADGRPLVFIAEAGEQLGYLPPSVAVAFTWQQSAAAPPRRRRGTRRRGGASQ